MTSTSEPFEADPADVAEQHAPGDQGASVTRRTPVSSADADEADVLEQEGTREDDLPGGAK